MGTLVQHDCQSSIGHEVDQRSEDGEYHQFSHPALVKIHGTFSELIVLGFFTGKDLDQLHAGNMFA